MNTRARRVSLVSVMLVVAGVAVASVAWAGPQRHERSLEQARHGAPVHEQRRGGKHHGHDDRGPWRGIHDSRGRDYGYGDRYRGDNRKHGRRHGHDRGRHYPPAYAYPPRHHGPPACRDYRHRQLGRHFHDHYGQPHFYFGLRTGDGGFVIYN